MSNYFDNQKKWAWNVTNEKATITTDHGTHTHTLDLTNVPIGELADNTGQVMGDAHREAAHDFDTPTIDAGNEGIDPGGGGIE